MPNPPEVDYRFILANERTFLAWMRTALGLVAGGVALDQFVNIGSHSPIIRLIALGAIGLGALVAVVGIVQWRRADVAMYSSTPMPRTKIIPVLGVAFIVLAIAVAFALTIWG